MASIPIDRQRPIDWLSSALVSGFVATAAMLVAFLILYAVAAFFASVEPANSMSARMMNDWFLAVTSSPLVDIGQNAFYVMLIGQLVLALIGAVAYAAVGPRWDVPGWVTGLVFAIPVWLVAVAVILPLAGGGFLGLAMGAGPLPLIGTSLQYGVYGAVLGAVSGALSDDLFGPITAEDDAALQGAMLRGANGVVAGILVGVTAGLVLAVLLAQLGERPLFGLPPAAIVLAAALVGSATGALIGSLAGLSVAPLGPDVRVHVAVAVAIAQSPASARAVPSSNEERGSLVRNLPLREIDLFMGLPDADLDALAKLGERRQFAPGEWLAREGASANSLIALLRGEAQLTLIVDGKSIVLRHARAGEALPLVALTDRPGPLAGIRALTEVEAFVLPRERLFALVDAEPRLGMHIYRRASQIHGRNREHLLERMRRGYDTPREAVLAEIV